MHMKIKVSKETLEDIKKWLAEYIGVFKKYDPGIQENIELKKDHTRRVCENIIFIGSKLGLRSDELRLAEIIALLHDAGRFEQYARYGTFKDGKSVNHAELGIQILEKNGVLKNLDYTIQDLVKRSIKYHNHVSLPPEETETCLFYSRLLRDADKLDIWKVVTDYYHRKNRKINTGLELELPDTPGISEKVLEAIRNKKAVNMKDVQNLNDFKMLQAGWIFDINFEASLEIIRERHYLEKIKAALPQSTETDEIFDFIYSNLKFPPS